MHHLNGKIIIIIIIILLLLLLFFRPSVLHSFRNCEWKKHKLGVSQLVTSHFHLKIAERIGETDRNKALDRNGKVEKGKMSLVGRQCE